MTVRLAFAGLNAILAFSTPAFADAVSLYSVTGGPTCSDHSRREEGLWVCTGPSGYRVVFTDEGNLSSIAIGPSADLKGHGVFHWRGDIVGNLLEWRIRDRRPEAAIVRIRRTEASSDGTERNIRELIVLGRWSARFCHVASVDTRLPHANEIARRLADQIPPLVCTPDE